MKDVSFRSGLNKQVMKICKLLVLLFVSTSSFSQDLRPFALDGPATAKPGDRITLRCEVDNISTIRVGESI